MRRPSRHLAAVVRRYHLAKDWTPGPGKSINDKGYVQFRTRTSNYGRYEHRVVMETAIQECNPFGWAGIPDGYHVHHSDFVTVHNCRQNLILLDSRIHDAINPQTVRRCPYTGKFLSVVEWEVIYGSGADEVPF